jgi:hypothetical protein
MPSPKAVAIIWPMVALTSSSVSATSRASAISSMTLLGTLKGERLSIEFEPFEA